MNNKFTEIGIKYRIYYFLDDNDQYKKSWFK